MRDANITGEATTHSRQYYFGSSWKYHQYLSPWMEYCHPNNRRILKTGPSSLAATFQLVHLSTYNHLLAGRSWRAMDILLMINLKNQSTLSCVSSFIRKIVAAQAAFPQSKLLRRWASPSHYATVYLTVKNQLFTIQYLPLSFLTVWSWWWAWNYEGSESYLSRRSADARFCRIERHIYTLASSSISATVLRRFVFILITSAIPTS